MANSHVTRLQPPTTRAFAIGNQQSVVATCYAKPDPVGCAPHISILSVASRGQMIHGEDQLRALREAIDFALGETPDQQAAMPKVEMGGALPAGWRIDAASSVEIRLVSVDGYIAIFSSLRKSRDDVTFLNACRALLKDN